MKKIAVFPGTFDPVTIGHVDIVNRALLIFDELIVAVGKNSGKQPFFSEVQRLEWLTSLFSDNPKVKVIEYEGLTVDCCQQVGAAFIIRGVRNGTDLEYERAIADVNRIANQKIETVFITARPEYSTISSTLVRDMVKNGRNIDAYLPFIVAESLRSR